MKQTQAKPRKASQKMPIIIGGVSSAMNERWYYREGTATSLEHFLGLMKKTPPKAISYFKVYRKLRGGSALIEQYWKTFDNGYMVYFDLGQMKMGIVQGLPTQYTFAACTKREYMAAQKKLMSALCI